MKPETKYKHKKSDDFEILEYMELSFLWATDPNFLLSRNIGLLYRGARDWLCIRETYLRELAYMIPYFP